jgi:hypothetical protein
VKFAEARTSCELLLEQGDVVRAVMVLERALPTLRTEDERRQALELVERVPETQRIESLAVATVYARVLNRNRRFSEVIEFCTRAIAQHKLEQVGPNQLHRGKPLRLNTSKSHASLEHLSRELIVSDEASLEECTRIKLTQEKHRLGRCFCSRTGVSWFVETL